MDKSLTNANATFGLSNVSTEMTIDKRGGNSDDVDKTAWDVTIILTDNNKRVSKFEVEEMETKIVTLVLKHVPIISDDDNEIGKIDLLYTTKEIVQTDMGHYLSTYSQKIQIFSNLQIVASVLDKNHQPFLIDDNQLM